MCNCVKFYKEQENSQIGQIVDLISNCHHNNKKTGWMDEQTENTNLCRDRFAPKTLIKASDLPT